MVFAGTPPPPALPVLGPASNGGFLKIWRAVEDRRPMKFVGPMTATELVQVGPLQNAKLSVVNASSSTLQNKPSESNFGDPVPGTALRIQLVLVPEWLIPKRAVSFLDWAAAPRMGPEF